MSTASKVIFGIGIFIVLTLVFYVFSFGLRNDVEAPQDEQSEQVNGQDELADEQAEQGDDGSDEDDPVDETARQTVTLYYYNPSLDEDESGNIMCSQEGLVAVERTVPVTQTPIQDTIKLLIQGELTEAEQSRGVTTEFPLEGFALEGASLEGGTLTLAFNDPANETTGGSCRTGVLWLQIKETALQFDAVEEVRFQPEELFQP